MGFIGGSKGIKTIVFGSIFILNFQSFAQSDSLQSRYDQLLGKSETYQQYKVIVKKELDAVWMAAQDSIAASRKIIAQQQSEIKKINRELEDAKAAVLDAEEQRDETQQKLGTIGFMGITFSHGAYHSLVWSIIAVLAAAIVIIYGMALRARIVNRTTSSDYRMIQSEFEQFKERARSKETKIKRDLQTAINTLEEFKRGVKK